MLRRPAPALCALLLLRAGAAAAEPSRAVEATVNQTTRTSENDPIFKEYLPALQAYREDYGT